MRLLHTFEDGWTIDLIDGPDDLKIQDEVVHGGRSCLGYNAEDWLMRISDGRNVLASLRDNEENPRATLLWGDADYITQCRANTGEYFPYAGARAFDQQPRLIEDNKAVISLQCCPPGYMAGDIGERLEETKRVKEWYEALPKRED